MFAQQWDEDKYQELCMYSNIQKPPFTHTDIFLATFLLNNYKQVQELLEELLLAIAALQSGKSADDMDYHQHLKMEQEYLTTRKSEPEEDIVSCDYIVLLQNYGTAQEGFHFTAHFCIDIF